MILLDKNTKIADTMRMTYLKRKSLVCKCFKFKINKSSLSKEQKEHLKMMFVEAKWIYNYLLSQEDIIHFDYKNLNNITHKDKNGNDVNVSLKYIGSSLKQGLITQIINEIKGLSVLKKKGKNVGKLKFKSEFNSINFKQYGITHTIRGNKFKLQGIKKPIRVCGLKLLDKYKDEIDYANAHLLYDGNDYYISLTCYINKKEIKETYKNDIIGIDLGCKTTITTSNGDKYNVNIEESERLKKLLKKKSKLKKGSNNYNKTIKLIRKEYNHINNKKNDISNKIVHNILSENEIIVMLDEQINEWKNELTSTKIQHSILGRIKTKLISSGLVVVLDKWFPTTKYCECGYLYENITLNDRNYICPNCGIEEDRDVHAAKNMILFYQKYKDTVGTTDTLKSDNKPIKFSKNLL